MSIELIDVVRNAGREYYRARFNGNNDDARRVVRHFSDLSGLPESAAETMIDQFSRQPL